MEQMKIDVLARSKAFLVLAKENHLKTITIFHHFVKNCIIVWKAQQTSYLTRYFTFSKNISNRVIFLITYLAEVFSFTSSHSLTFIQKL